MRRIQGSCQWRLRLSRELSTDATCPSTKVSETTLPVPRVGDALVYNRYIYYHSAVYVGRGDQLLLRAEASMLSPDSNEARLPNCKYTLAEAYAAILKDVKIDPKSHYVMHYVPPTGWNLIDKLRHGLSRSFNVEFMEFDSVRRGSNLFIVSRPSVLSATAADGTSTGTNCGVAELTPYQEERLALAVRHYDSQLGGYNFFFNNCQHFATFVAFGKGAIYMWTLGQMTLFCALVSSIFGAGYLRCRYGPRSPDSKTTSSRPNLLPIVLISTSIIMGAIAARHGMHLRLIRASGPLS